jgi:large subunit ribosomal protein L16
MLQPKKTKYRKAFKGRNRGQSSRGFSLDQGQYGLKALGYARLTARQIESARRVITRQLKRMGVLWIRVYPSLPVTSKPAEVRMGSGKGSVDYWSVRVQPGRIIYEVDIGEAPEELARKAFRIAGDKLPFATCFVTRNARGGL